MNNEKISASLVLGSYLDTLGFNNGVWEFNYNFNVKTLNDAIAINYEILNNFFIMGGFNIDISDWIASDDTIMMIATMKACHKGGNINNFISEYIKILPALEDKKRISGITTLNSLRILEKTKNPKKIHYSDKMGGNGAAMRTHYIGIFFKDINKIIETSLIASRLTHNYPLGFLGGMTTALFTHYAINNIEPWKWCDLLIELNENKTIDNIIKNMTEFNDIFDKYMEDKEEFWTPFYKFRERRVKHFHTRGNEFIYGASRFTDLIEICYNINVNESIKPFQYDKFGGDGAAAIIIALDSILLSIISKNNEHDINLDKPDTLKYNWQSVIFFSTLHFGDNDTVGAITGMLYGALRGYDGVDRKIINMLEFKKELIL
jgi:ADP-ribosylarginine hydrolase